MTGWKGKLLRIIIIVLVIAAAAYLWWIYWGETWLLDLYYDIIGDPGYLPARF